MPKTNNPNQETLFTQGTISPKLEIPRDVNQNPPLTQGDIVRVEGNFPSVDLIDYAQGHLDALKDLGKHSSRTGGQIAGAEDSPFRHGLEQRYGDATDSVVHGMARSKERLMKSAKQNFAKAYGFAALKGSGLVTEEEATQMAREDFDRYVQKFADKKGDPARNQARKSLRKIERTQAKIRKDA